MNSDNTKTMRLISSEWNSVKSFGLMPVAEDCPFIEGIYDPSTKMLAMISKNKKEMFQMMPKLDDNGDYIRAKAKRPNGKEYREERKTLSTYHEHYITEIEEIKEFINSVAVNATSFDYTKYTEAATPDKEKKAVTVSS